VIESWRFCFYENDLQALRGSRASRRRGYVEAGDVPPSYVLFHTTIAAYVSNGGYDLNGYG